MNYWLDLFTGTTWRQFLEAGGTISGFRPRQRKLAGRMQPGDVMLCYLTGVMRWVGALEVIGPSNDSRPIWTDDFPVRPTTITYTRPPVTASSLSSAKPARSGKVEP